MLMQQQLFQGNDEAKSLTGKCLGRNGRGKLETLSKDNSFRDCLRNENRRNGMGRKKRILIQGKFLRWQFTSMFLCC